MKTLVLRNKLCFRTLISKKRQTKNSFISTKSLHLDDEMYFFFKMLFYLYISKFPLGTGTGLLFFQLGKIQPNCSGVTQNDILLK